MWAPEDEKKVSENLAGRSPDQKIMPVGPASQLRLISSKGSLCLHYSYTNRNLSIRLISLFPLPVGLPVGNRKLKLNSPFLQLRLLCCAVVKYSGTCCGSYGKSLDRPTFVLRKLLINFCGLLPLRTFRCINGSFMATKGCGKVIFAHIPTSM